MNTRPREPDRPRVPALYESTVAHARLAPVRHVFRTRTYFWLVDVDDLPRMPRGLRALARFDTRDHFGGRAPTPGAALRRYLRANGAHDADGRVLMLTQARVLGHVFNPLTLYWCHDRDDTLVCVVAEVHNTYGERHCYLMRPDAQGRADVPKDFYVSPFYGVEGTYRMRLPVPGDALDLSVQLHHGAGRPPFTATVRGRHRPASPRALLSVALRHPWSTAKVSLGIRLHGIRLYLRGLPVQPRPVHPTHEGTL
ncbi:DUF1365 domain-containing protein [Streptomyces sp. NPDC056470]|uniref:DUF1365 domain-containing protein n=1 Tax=Streptomyces sp. NPDC056470 TaxID=3345831 RepID=UPI0036B1EC4A